MSRHHRGTVVKQSLAALYFLFHQRQGPSCHYSDVINHQQLDCLFKISYNQHQKNHQSSALLDFCGYTGGWWNGLVMRYAFPCHHDVFMCHAFSNDVTNLDNSHIARFMGPTWGPPGSCRPQMGPMLAPWTLLSGLFDATFLKSRFMSYKYSLLMHCIKIKSRAKSLLNEQYVFVVGNISFLCVLSCSSEEA